MLGNSYSWSLMPSVILPSGLVLSNCGFLEAFNDGDITLCENATGLPSLESPAFIAEKVIGRKGPNCVSSSLVQINFTGLPICFEIDAASTAKSCESLLPKPPPLKSICTFTLSSEILNAFATCVFTNDGPCDDAQISTMFPSCQCATQFIGSIEE